ncbi:A/G-specific adenine glycosylase [bacterium]|nr:A/G-specific adenine glycosylase [bacterium]
MPKPTLTAKDIVTWYSKNARDLPWRKTIDPYKIWLSEIILQQTTVAQGTSYYLKFISVYPTLTDLASAPIDDVLKNWQGLGYYSRARNLHFSANYIINECNGIFPNNYIDLLKLKGVGAYTAAAISSFSYKENKVVVDGNVIRVISRLYGINEAVDNPKVLKLIKEKAQQLCDTQSPEVFNQAIMEFGALQCKAKNPNCKSCPLQKSCIAYKKNIQDQIPFKAKRIKKTNRYFKYCFFIIDNSKTLIIKRSEKDIWQGLYEFPLLELEALEEEHGFVMPKNIKIRPSEVLTSKIFKHQLTHQTIRAVFYKTYISQADYNLMLKKGVFNNYLLINVENINKYALPRLIDLYLNDLSITLF